MPYTAKSLMEKSATKAAPRPGEIYPNLFPDDPPALPVPAEPPIAISRLPGKQAPTNQPFVPMPQAPVTKPSTNREHFAQTVGEAQKRSNQEIQDVQNAIIQFPHTVSRYLTPKPVVQSGQLTPSGASEVKPPAILGTTPGFNIITMVIVLAGLAQGLELLRRRHRHRPDFPDAGYAQNLPRRARVVAATPVQKRPTTASLIVVASVSSSVFAALVLISSPLTGALLLPFAAVSVYTCYRLFDQWWEGKIRRDANVPEINWSLPLIPRFDTTWPTITYPQFPNIVIQKPPHVIGTSGAWKDVQTMLDAFPVFRTAADPVELRAAGERWGFAPSSR